MIEQTVPHSPEIEKGVLAGMMIDDDAIIKAMDTITENVFYNPVNAMIFSAICKMHLDKIPIDEFTLCEHLKKAGQLETVGGESHISGLYNMATTSANIEYHSRILLEKANLRKLIALSKSIEEKCLSYDANTEEITESLINNTFGIISKGRKKPYYDMMEATLETSEELYSLIESGGKLSGIQTGFSKLDEMIDGLQKGDLLILAGLPETGKTSLALNIAKYVVNHGISAAFFSMEMPLRKLCRRLISSDTRQDYSARTRRDYTKIEVDIAVKAFNRLSLEPLYINTESGLTHIMLYTKMEQLKREKGIQVVFIDHLQLMVGTSEFKGNRRLQIEEITRHMKKYAKDLDIPIVLLSHLSREPEKQDRRPRLSDLRETAMIEADADIVIFIHKPAIKEIISSMSKIGKVYTEEEASHVRELLVLKDRNGPTGRIYLYWEPSYTQFGILDY